MGKKKRKVVRRYTKPQNIISDDFIIPNHSGDHTAGTTETPQKDKNISNKKYVDDTNSKEAVYRTRIPKPIVTFMFDDGYDNVYEDTMPMFEEQGIVGCTCINTATIGTTSNYMTWAQVKELKRLGWEILSHSHNHTRLTLLTEAEIRDELQTSIDTAKEHGIDLINISYPWGANNELVRQVSRELFRSGRGTDLLLGNNPIEGANTIVSFDVMSRPNDDHTLLADYKTLVDEAEANNTWLTFHAHSLTAEDLPNYNELIDYIQAKGINILTYDQALDEMGNYIDTGENFKVHENGVYIGNLQIKIEYEDLQVQIGAVGFGSSAPTKTSYKGGEILAFNKSQDNKIFFTAQIPHSYKEGEDIEFHIHTSHSDSNAGNSVWNLTYSWANIDSDLPAETTASATMASPSDVDKHELHEVAATIDGTGKTISSVLICSLEREGTNASDTYDNDIYLLAIDFHVPVNTIGSKTESAK